MLMERLRQWQKSQQQTTVSKKNSGKEQGETQSNLQKAAAIEGARMPPSQSQSAPAKQTSTPSAGKAQTLKSQAQAIGGQMASQGVRHSSEVSKSQLGKLSPPIPAAKQQQVPDQNQRHRSLPAEQGKPAPQQHSPKQPGQNHGQAQSNQPDKLQQMAQQYPAQQQQQQPRSKGRGR